MRGEERKINTNGDSFPVSFRSLGWRTAKLRMLLQCLETSRSQRQPRTPCSPRSGWHLVAHGVSRGSENRPSPPSPLLRRGRGAPKAV